jgi:ornithine decarboxylase
MHPVKAPAAIRAAYRDYGVRHFVVDHGDEIDKLVAALGGAPGDLVPVVRLATPSDGALFNLSEKFGAEPAQAAALLRAVEAAGCRPGLCFHVGSQCTRPRAYREALALAGEVLAAAGVAPCCLDLGGGFPTAYDGETMPGLEAYFEAIEAGLAPLALAADCVVMCEPGRALVAEAMSLVAQVQHRRDRKLYINDGIYGSLHGSKLGVRYPVRLIRPGRPAARQAAEFTVFGPTCDNLDVLSAPLVLPADTGQGDWIEFAAVGAYGNALRTEFNGFRPDTFVSIP